MLPEGGVVKLDHILHQKGFKMAAERRIYWEEAARDARVFKGIEQVLPGAVKKPGGLEHLPGLAIEQGGQDLNGRQIGSETRPGKARPDNHRRQ